MKKLLLLTFSTMMMFYTYGAQKIVTSNSKMNQKGLDVVEQTDVEFADIQQLSRDTIITPVKVADLPQPVKDAIAKYEYDGWEVKPDAYLIKTEENPTELYEITLFKSASGIVETIKLDKNGKSVK